MINWADTWETVDFKPQNIPDARAWYSGADSSKLFWQPIVGFLVEKNGNDEVRAVAAVLHVDTGDVVPASFSRVGTFVGVTAKVADADFLKHAATKKAGLQPANN
jgi:hypothetical protein